MKLKRFLSVLLLSVPLLLIGSARGDCLDCSPVSGVEITEEFGSFADQLLASLSGDEWIDIQQEYCYYLLTVC